MNFNNKIKPVGVFYLEILKDGIIIDKYEDNNLIVNGGMDAISKLIGAADTNADKRITKIGFGTDGADPLITNTGLTGLYSKAITAVSYPSVSTIQVDFTLGSGENNGVTIREFGLICEDNTLFARKIRAAIDKTAAISLNGTWSITF